MTSISTNYNGRTSDLCIMQGFVPSATPVPILTSFMSSSGGMICTGIAKLCQKVLLLLFTQSMHYDAYWGTNLPLALNSGSIQQAMTNIQNVFGLVISDVVDQLNAQRTPDTPDDERLDSIALNGLFMYTDLGIIQMRITIYSLAGAGVSVVLPIKKLI